MPEKRKKKAIYPWLMYPSTRQLLNAAAEAEGRPLSNWLERFVVPFALSQVEGDSAGLEPADLPEGEVKVKPPYSWRLHEAEKAAVEKAAKLDGRSVSNWLDVWGAALATRQLGRD